MTWAVVVLGVVVVGLGIWGWFLYRWMKGALKAVEEDLGRLTEEARKFADEVRANSEEVGEVFRSLSGRGWDRRFEKCKELFARRMHG